MADVSIDSAAGGAQNARGTHIVVFVSDQVGYVFYSDAAASDLVYSKTTDGGATWGAAVVFESSDTAIAFGVWYDRWTPGDSGTKIHLAFFDTSIDDIWYRSLDTNGDTLGSRVTALALGSAVAGRGCFTSITKARSGYIYIAGDIDAGAERFLIRSTDGGANWSANLSTTFVEATIDECLLFPASNTGDDNDIWALYQDASTDELTLKMWDSSAASATESAEIGASMAEGTTDGTHQRGFAGSIRHSDGHLICAVNTAYDSGDLRVYDINGTGSITALTAIQVGTDDIYHPAVFIDQGTNDIYVAYNGKRDGSETLGTSTKVYYTKSTDDGATWSAGDTAYMEGAAAAVSQVWVPLSGPRFYPVWRTGNTLNGNNVNSLVFLEARSGTLSQTLGAVALSGVATNANRGTTSQTLNAVTVSAAGANAIAAAVAQTLGAVTLTGEATLDDGSLTADLAQTLAAVSVAASGSNAIAAAASQSLGTVALSGSGTNAIQAAVQQSLGTVTLSSGAKAAVAASSAVQLGSFPVSGSASSAIRAAVSRSLDTVTLSAQAGDDRITADVAVTLGDVGISADATVSQPEVEEQPQDEVIAVRGPEEFQLAHGSVVISGGGSVEVSGRAQPNKDDMKKFWRVARAAEDFRTEMRP